MDKKPTIIARLDNRRAKTSGKYPVKIKITYERLTRYINTNVDLTVDEYQTINNNGRVPKHLSISYAVINACLGRVISVIDDLKDFSFDAFFKKYDSTSYGSHNVFDHIEEKIKKLKADDRLSTAEGYDLARKSFKKFLGMNDDGRQSILKFTAVDKNWLERYEKFMIDNDKSSGTVGVYLRYLRHIFNIAIKDGLITEENYPFGATAYKLPAKRKRKAALSKEDVLKIFSCDTLTASQKEARALWLLSYNCNGCNLADIAHFTKDCLKPKSIVFVRQKTARTIKDNQQEIIIIRNEYINSFLNEHMKHNSDDDGYLLNIINRSMTLLEQRRAIKNKTRFVNQHMKSLAKKLGIEADISLVWARHSFTTAVMRSGASLMYVKDSLGHQNITTTMNYWGGFEDDTKKVFSDGLMKL